MPQKFEKIWFSTEERMQVFSKWVVMGLVYDDRGELKVKMGILTFQGKKERLTISNVHSLSLFHLKPLKVMQNLIVVLMIVMSGLTLFMGIFFAAILHDLIPAFYLVITEGLLLVLFLMCISLLIFNFSSKGPLGSTWWVKVDCRDEENNRQTVYFTDGSWNGWGGIFGGTRQLYTHLKQAVSATVS